MKNRSPLQSGVALVIVLGFLVLISVLVVAFFSSVTTELKASRNYSSGVTTRQLSESATQIVMGQIRSATTRTRAAWASQPGMIRTYRQNATTVGSQADAFFKLYSSDKMVVSGNAELKNLVSGADFAQDWDTKPALWTDLNAPVMVKLESKANEVPRFPIIDPRAYFQKTANRNTTIKPSANTDPSEINTEGFWYGSDKDFSTTPNGLVLPGGNADSQRLPMPVRWIYVLQDGTLTSPGDTGAGSTNLVAKWTAGGSDNFQIPTKENPIVGRIAFWSDDDSNKVNVNTAGGFVDAELDPALSSINYNNDNYAGSFWDTPRFYTQFERGMPYKESLGSSGSNKAGTPYPGGGGLAICQLLQNEFQRYPGHPSTTSLGLILGPYMRTPVGANAVYTRADQMYSVLPRLGIASNNGVAAGQQAGSTKGGIFRIIPSNPTTQANPVAQDLQIMPKGDRLYANLDELYFAAKSNDPANSTSYARLTNDRYLQSSANPLPPSSSALSPENLEKLRFFLTAQNRSPELNLFGFPRITIWPVRFETASEASGLNPFDNVILFCSTIGVDPNQAPTGRPNTMKAPTQAQSPLQAGLTPGPTGSNGGPPYRYIFTRRELPTVTTGILPAPAQTWSGSSTWVPDIDQPRNKQLMVYLQRLTSAPIPGFGGAFTSKYSNDDRDQILTEIFDYIRCANLQDTTTRTIGQTTAIQFSSKGTVIPSKPAYLQASKTFTGFGRFPAISEATLVFYYAGPELSTADVPAGNATVGPQRAGWIKVDADGYAYGRKMRAFVLFSFFNPMQGYAPTKDPLAADPKISIEVTGLSNMQVSWQGQASTPIGFPGGALTTKLYSSSQRAWGGRNFGGFEGFMHTLVGDNTAAMPNKIMEMNAAGTGVALAAPYNANWSSNGSALSSAPFAAQELYPFQTKEDALPPIPTSVKMFDVNECIANVNVGYGGRVIQTLQLKFPATTGLPVPKGDPGLDPDLAKRVSLVGVNASGNTAMDTSTPTNATPRALSRPVKNASAQFVDLRDPQLWKTVQPGWTNGQIFINQLKRAYWEGLGCFYPAAEHGSPPASGSQEAQNYASRTTIPASWTFARRLAWSLQPSHSPWRNNSNSTTLNSFRDRWKCIVQPGDTIRSLVYWGNAADALPPNNVGAVKGGDLRLALIPTTNTNSEREYAPHPNYQTNSTTPGVKISRATSLRLAEGTPYFNPGSSPSNYPVTGGPVNDDLTGASESTFGNHVTLAGASRIPLTKTQANLPYGANNAQGTGGVNGLRRFDNLAGDFDTGIGNMPDGPYLNKPDEGNIIFAYQDPATGEWRYPVPYFGTWAYEQPGNTFTSPFRQMPSPGMFGSLPSRAATRRGWETLCFSPNPAGDGHPGNSDPKDHLLLDLFNMPVVEPYPISEPFSSAGKVNLNYKIMPFGYIARSTALRAALHPTRVTAVGSVANFDKYKTGESSNGQSASGIAQYDVEKTQNMPIAANFRKVLDRDATIQGFDDFFQEGASDPDRGFFKSASQVCERYLYPSGGGNANDGQMKSWWATQDLGGDNTREKPYTDLYPRVTTKSNTFTVHMRVQTLRQIPRTNSADYAKWEEGRDSILGEYRGASTIERYIDPADPRFDPTNTSNFVNPDDVLSGNNLESIYRFRTVITKKFAPY